MVARSIQGCATRSDDSDAVDIVIPLMLVWLRAAGLVGQAVTLGGAAFSLIVLGCARTRDGARALDLTLALDASGALLAAIAQDGTIAALADAHSIRSGLPVMVLL